MPVRLPHGDTFSISNVSTFYPTIDSNDFFVQLGELHPLVHLQYGCR
jgi:hypothetical protein